MQVPPKPGLPSGAVAFLVFGAAAFGCVGGSSVTYLGMRAARKAQPQISAPTGKGFGDLQVKQRSDGWYSYSFTDLDLSMDAPCEFSPKRRLFPEKAAKQLVETADYDGHSNSGSWQIGAFWSREHMERDPVAVAKYNYLERADMPAHGDDYKFEPITVDGCPACHVTGSYDDGARAYFHCVYVVRGNGLYYLRSTFWEFQKASAGREWERTLTSLRFLNKAAMTR